MGRRKGWQRALEQLFCVNRPLDICLCRCKKNLDEVAKILCDGEIISKKHPKKENKKN